MALKAIETLYCGIRFRSRLEAKWATFFDYLLIPWEYEKEGYDLGSGIWYLPDFWLPQQNCWIEIKGQPPTEQEELKCRLLAEQSEHRVLLFSGQIHAPDYCDDNLYYAQLNGGCDWNYLFCTCPTCGKIGIEYEARGARICRHDDCDRGHTPQVPRIIAAYKAAMQTRFENYG